MPKTGTLSHRSNTDQNDKVDLHYKPSIRDDRYTYITRGRPTRPWTDRIFFRIASALKERGTQNRQGQWEIDRSVKQTVKNKRRARDLRLRTSSLICTMENPQPWEQIVGCRRWFPWIWSAVAMRVGRSGQSGRLPRNIPPCCHPAASCPTFRAGPDNLGARG